MKSRLQAEGRGARLLTKKGMTSEARAPLLLPSPTLFFSLFPLGGEKKGKGKGGEGKGEDRGCWCVHD